MKTALEYDDILFALDDLCDDHIPVVEEDWALTQLRDLRRRVRKAKEQLLQEIAAEGSN